LGATGKKERKRESEYGTFLHYERYHRELFPTNEDVVTISFNRKERKILGSTTSVRDFANRKFPSSLRAMVFVDEQQERKMQKKEKMTEEDRERKKKEI
jgi:hypothetical protein